MKKIFFVFLLFFIVPPSVFASTNFYDGFDDLNYKDRWEIIHISPDDTSSVWEAHDWGIVNGQFGVYLGGKQMRTHAVLRLENLSNYVYSFKLIGKRGEDKNILFRYKDKNNWYGFHISGAGTFFGARKNGIYSDVRLSGFSFANNTAYDIRIILIDDRVSFIVNDVTIVSDYKIQDNFITTGTVGLKVSTGATYPSEVYFDDIKITRINTPVILIPGHGASFNFKEMFLGQSDPGGWRMMPGVNVYKNIITSLEANGYEEGKDLFVFNYNWLESISDSANKLYNFIEDIVDSSYFSSVKVVGHSMGGLVGQACLSSKENDCFIDQLVTVGSPHRGVLETYAAWEGGEVWRGGLTKLAFELFLNLKRERLETNKEVVRRLTPSTQEMLPIFAYLKNSQGEEIEFNQDNYPQNPLLGGLAGSYEKDSFVFGQNQQTLRWLTVSQDLPWTDRVLGNWEFGKPVAKEFSDEGDGTVLKLSAYPDQEVSGSGFDFGHSEIISSPVAVAEIMTLLGLEPTPGLEFLANEENFLVFYLHSPAHLEIADLPPEALLGKDGEVLKLVIIANPSLTEDYLVDVVGEGSGHYRLTVGKIEGDKSSWQDFSGSIDLGETDSFSFNFTDFEKSVVDDPVQSIEELLSELEEILAGQEETVLKLVHWNELINTDHLQALIYGYRLRNWLSLQAKEDHLSEAVFLDSLDRVDSILVYLEKLVLESQGEIREEKHRQILEFWEEERNSFPTPPTASGSLDSLSKLAALDFIGANRYYSLLSEEPGYRDLTWAFSGLGLLRNSRILLEGN